MAKAKKTEVEASLVSSNPEITKPRLIKLIIKNYRCIGSTPVEIDLNDIVVLVGANNVGKSSILKAYELAMSQGSGKADLKREDFPNNTIDNDNLPEIELHTIVYDNSPGDKWIQVLENGEMLVRERWVWNGEGKPKREGWEVEASSWSENVPWGAPNVANARRPEPHRVDAFDSPEEQAKAIKKLLMQALNDRVKNLKAQNQEEGQEENDYKKLIAHVKALQKKIVLEAKDQIDAVNQELSDLVARVFPNYKIDFDAKPEDDLDSAINLFKADPQLLMGPADGYLSTIDRQGSGARRTLLWTAIKFISENNQKGKDNGAVVRPHLLLIDEPEICLHPNAIREACNLLYDLPSSDNWQVMVTTHSPIFIDFSKDNTTIIKVEKTSNGEIKGTTVFRPDKVQLDDDDKRNLKLLNICDPYVAEFFFGGKVIVVEGDTEYTAFNYIKRQKPEEYKDINIIRARGKATIVSLIKVLNHFGSDYAVLHDCDIPIITTKRGIEMANPAWGNNPNILNAMNAKPVGKSTRLLASLPNFELAYFGEVAENEKPYNALRTLEQDEVKFDTVEALLKALVDFASPPPINCTEWTSIEDLEQKLMDSLSG
ncbi:AAA family ATPase [Panacibacter ginsenosidivorans]|uniref:AAA family ATPase n=1 Tax=Panacibacter ginsenosidivorans TaxID=1813871 RepID=A0A5B8VFL7_9BACT|nr:AAA family ATPase [Panacibacter ginsenosidivorans]QEC69336.1 AAA family ATPase [Panacibacter ginsenosidivorans]